MLIAEVMVLFTDVKHTRVRTRQAIYFMGEQRRVLERPTGRLYSLTKHSQQTFTAGAPVLSQFVEITDAAAAAACGDARRNFDRTSCSM